MKFYCPNEASTMFLAENIATKIFKIKFCMKKGTFFAIINI
jgi:hypothetical protein